MALKLFHRHRITALAVCLACATQALAAKPAPQSSATVLMYQRVGDDRYPSTNVTLSQFESHLAYLETQQFEVWPLPRLIEHAQSGKPFPSKVVALTFDDAYRSTFLNALPKLKRRHWPYTLFVWTDAIDGRYPAYMSWDELRAAQTEGATIGNHSASHTRLLARRTGETTTLWQQRAKKDIEKAHRRIRAELGSAPSLFAYPYGEYNAELASIVTSMEMAGFGEQSGPIDRHMDLRALPRFPISQAHAGREDFALRVNSLAMPVQATQPWNPEHPRNAIPRLDVHLAESLPQPNQIKCFGPANTPLKVSWKDKNYRDFEIAPPSRSESDGRTRINCTAPAGKNQYYWFSRLWVEQYPRPQR